MGEIRLNKYLAEHGVCSRRDADKLIENGKVTVNGKIAIMGQRVTEEDNVSVDGRLLGQRDTKVVLRYYKPIGVTCTERDEYAKYKITDVVKYPIRVTYAGRLDKESEGLLILTNDGELIDRMMRGGNNHEKEYIVKVNREITPDFLLNMSAGIYLKDLDITTRKCEIEQVGRYTFRIVLTQGVNRQIRRMCKTLGFEVKSLKRVRILNLSLKGLKEGEFEQVKGKELEELYRLVGMNTQLKAEL